MDIGVRARVAGLVGVAGGAVMAVALIYDHGAWGFSNLVPFVLPASAGAVAGGAFFARLFGQAGRSGWGLALAGAALSTGLGAALGAFLLVLFATPSSALSGLMIGPVFVVMAILGLWPVALVWVLGFTAIHLSARRYLARAHANGSGEARGVTP